MKHLFIPLLIILTACNVETSKTINPSQIEGTWQLISSEYHRKDSITSNMTVGQEMIKIISPSHFAFFLHDLKKGKDSTNIAYMSGGGSYSFINGKYTENLQFCTARDWENNSFTFDIQIIGDTLIQQGLEEMESLGLGTENLLLIEKYVRIDK